VRPSERLGWTADVVAPSPSDRVLEVGCGHGVLVSLFAARLTTGLVVGIDRVLAPVVAWSLMGAEMQAPVEEAVGRLAGARDLVEAGLHRGRTAPTESVALELRRGI
jgi:hypothetical protein